MATLWPVASDSILPSSHMHNSTTNNDKLKTHTPKLLSRISPGLRLSFIERNRAGHLDLGIDASPNRIAKVKPQVHVVG